MNPAYTDPELLSTTLDLANRWKIDTFIETGTFDGKNIALLAPHFNNLHSIEINEELYNKAIENNKGNNVKLYNSCSTKALPEILGSVDKPYIIFLDAHWEDYFPILDELEIIKNRGIEPIIIIHDVFVPDKSLGYDKYGDVVLNFEYVKEKLDTIYKNGYLHHFSDTSINDSGVLYVYPNIIKSVLKDFKIPSWAKRVNLDVGTSLNAPYSEEWLKKDKELCVIGFEPNPHNCKILKKGQSKWLPHLKSSRINNSFFLINAALSDGTPRIEKFYCTDEGNPGTSSLYKPLYFNVVDEIKIPVITLKDFFDKFPWEQIPYISHLKIDAQSSDENIILGAGLYLSEKVLYLTIETNTGHQYENEEHPEEMKKYIESQGFECVEWSGDGSFLNKKLQKQINGN